MSKSCYRRNDDKSLSKLLSWLLRHGAVKEGLNIGTDGFVDVTDIEQYRGFCSKYTVADIQRVVAESDKQRFTLRTHPVSGKLQIKANQGHSIDFIQDSDLIPIHHASDIQTVIHGTYLKNWTKIKTEGLSRMNRLHIHFSPGELGDSQVVSGIRSSCQLYIYIDAEKALTDGIPFYRSANNVILSPGNSKGYIEPKYFSKVTEVSTIQEFEIITMQNPIRCAICEVDMPNKESLALHLLGKRHLRGLQLLEQKKVAEEKGIYVRGFPKQTDQVQLQAFFSQFGPIKKFIYGSRGNFAIVQFCERQSAEICLSKTLYFHGCHLHVKRQKIRNPLKQTRPPQVAASAGLDHTHITATLSSCEDNFQSQLSALLNEIHLSDYSKYAVVCGHLEATFSVSFPGCKAQPFGSAVTGLAFKGSDLDVFMDLNVALAVFGEGASVSTPVPESPSRGINHAKKLLHQNSNLYSNIFAIPKAKTPIVKFIHKPTKISCDLSFKNALGVNNSALIKFYLSMDPRLRPFLIIIKYWARKNDLSGHGKISNYALVMIALFYLQQLEHPVIPIVTTLQEGVNEKLIIDGWECSINTNISLPNNNTMSLPELLCGFFKFCSHFDYGMKVICPLLGTSLLKSVFQTPEALPEAMHRYKEYMSSSGSDVVGLKVDCDMCIQDPFELRHNLTAGMSSKALENFKTYCEAAAKVCDEELSSTDASAPTFLKKLLHESTKPSELLCHVTILREKCLIHKLPENVDSEQQESSANTENELRMRWYKSVLEFLIQIFEDVMKFNVQIEESEHNSKIQKLDGQSDIREVLSCAGVKVIHCCGYWRVWEGRKSASKKLKFPENMVTITKERMISDFLYEQFKQQASKGDPVVTFCCIFQPKQEPTRVVLELADKKSHKSDFKVLSAFLQGRLPVWIGRCMKWQQSEQQVAEKEA